MTPGLLHDCRIRQAEPKLYRVKVGKVHKHTTTPAEECCVKVQVPESRIQELIARAEQRLPLFEEGPPVHDELETGYGECVHCHIRYLKYNGLPQGWRRLFFYGNAGAAIVECKSCSREWDERWGDR